MNRWNSKHPIPWDFFNTFNNISGQDLNWFWNSWYFSNNYIDFSIHSATKNKNGYAVALQNIGGYPAPFDLVITYEDGTAESQHQTPALWKADLKMPR
jgi:hypothetical protein